MTAVIKSSENGAKRRYRIEATVGRLETFTLGQSRVDHKPFLKGDLIMKHQKKLVYVLSLCFLFLLLPGCDGPAEEAGEKIDETVEKQKENLEDAKNEITEAREEIEELKDELAQARQERDEAKTRLEEAEQERQRILKEMEQEQSDSGPQGEEEMQPQSESMENAQQPAKETSS